MGKYTTVLRVGAAFGLHADRDVADTHPSTLIFATSVTQGF